jgi:hypothetical protein
VLSAWASATRRRVSCSASVDVRAEGTEQVRRRALHGVHVDSTVGRSGRGRRDQRKPGDAVTTYGHGG